MSLIVQIMYTYYQWVNIGCALYSFQMQSGCPKKYADSSVMHREMEMNISKTCVTPWMQRKTEF